MALDAFATMRVFENIVGKEENGGNLFPQCFLPHEIQNNII